MYDVRCTVYDGCRMYDGMNGRIKVRLKGKGEADQCTMIDVRGTMDVRCTVGECLE